MERPTTLVVDASVVVKWFVPETDTSEAVAIRDAHASQEISLFAPDLLVYEVANALRHRSDVAAVDVEAGIKALFELDLSLIAPTTASVSGAASLARMMDITVYDSTYLALARDLDCKLVTADRILHDKVVSVGKSTETILLKDYATQLEDRTRDVDLE